MENVYQTQSKRLLFLMLAAAALLTVPLIAMQFTSEVKWGIFDFIAAGVLLFGAAMAVEVALRLVTSLWMRLAVCAAILLALGLAWAELAVGIFGSPIAGS